MILGMVLILVGYLLAFSGILLKMGFFNETREIELKWKYGLCIGLSLLGTVPAAIGFYLVIGETPIHPKQDYSQILGILSLLAAGTITGFFTFSYQNVRKDEVALPTFLSVSFATMFYLIFSGICLYMGKSESIHNVEAAAQYVPAIMWLLLLANVMYDFLDYRTNDDPNRRQNSFMFVMKDQLRN